MNKQQYVWGIAVQFLVFAMLLSLLVATGGSPNKVRFLAGGGVLLFVLLLAVLLSILRLSHNLERTIESLKKELAVEKSTNHNIQTQFEEAIEKRTYELQTVNGALNREVAERIQAEEEARELQKQLNLILDSAGEGILGLDNHGRVIFINKAATLMLGWQADELLGSTHHDLIHHTHPDGSIHPVENCPIYMAYRDGQVHYKTGDVFWCQNGSSFPVEYVSTPIRDRGMLTGAVVVFRDMNTYK